MNSWISHEYDFQDNLKTKLEDKLDDNLKTKFGNNSIFQDKWKNVNLKHNSLSALHNNLLQSSLLAMKSKNINVKNIRKSDPHIKYWFTVITTAYMLWNYLKKYTSPLYYNYQMKNKMKKMKKMQHRIIYTISLSMIITTLI